MTEYEDRMDRIVKTLHLSPGAAEKQRLGMGLCQPGPDGWRQEWGLYLSDAYGVTTMVLCAHEGARHADLGMRGIALGGPGWRPSQTRVFDAKDYVEVTWFVDPIKIQERIHGTA